MVKVFLIEDDAEFAGLIAEFLGSRGISVEACEDPFLAISTDLAQFDLVLLDLGLPGMDGLEVCKEIRKKSKIPVIVSSARASTVDKVSALQIGADDYLPKPYDPDELYARIISLLRRANDFKEESENLAFSVDKNLGDVLFNGVNLGLTLAEFEVLGELVRNFPAAVSKEQILRASPSIVSANEKNLEMIISKIRAKIKPHSEANHIISLRGRGYRLAK
ncbi:MULTISPECIES: response regulator transcription factor [unclassified Campylobacter]|uniref:response regulator transcription factor n=1 Tax=unclassified Campylobacter TaxID=2593542 RepID=UPI0022EA0CD1|nr:MULTISPECIES: response regulator transcription factor [unclassified Campylobacter]MDA3054572.1 response regulator transcription factor [Campylobacter sp. VBCF_07 NA4]MDA3060644.1 response regulator transcription factor [Campylobacter sp. VBCF_02 NA5]MDA3062228.1 response regulator transcription factor [Campylobacter sp. JMF_14 EL1]MDA3070090.1 response regulator transcription factor [Campylobacter sp. VBCF_08 NA3]MDA3073653.1 response regulator transcription factor [Campylobacter sp. JMF_10